MKKFSYLVVFACLLIGCNNDDDFIAACDQVTNVTASSITTTSASITWNDPNNVGSYIVEYGVAGFAFGAGTIISETATTATLDNLLPETTYDVYVQVVCAADNVSMYSGTYSFTTSTPTCPRVTGVQANAVSNTSATISWQDDDTVGSYVVEYGLSGFSIGTGSTVTETNLSTDLSDLNPESTYDVYIKTICAEDNISDYTEVYNFTTLATPVIPEFLPNLSQLNLFSGNLSDLTPSAYAFEYDLHSTLFSDYAHKQRLIALPSGTKMTYDGNGLPLFPDNSVIAKTFYYNNDETNLSLGKNIIETRILIKINGNWESGDYRWNEAQTEAVLDAVGGDVPVTWVDAEGATQSITYEIPSNADCFTCHQSYDNLTPIGPKLRTLNFSKNGTNQLQALIDSQLLEGLADPSTVSVLPKWDDEANYTLEERARAYMDINCASCHVDGGFCENQSILRIDFETAFEESGILNRKNSILTRIQSTIPQYGMPYIGTTIIHDEGVELLTNYLNSL